jgi:branched-chain amino acid transport system substrate-binding protein
MSIFNDTELIQRVHSNLSVSRRGLIKAGFGVTAVGFLLGDSPLSALAKSYPALGTFPAGSSGGSIFIGGVMPLTGPYSAS